MHYYNGMLLLYYLIHVYNCHEQKKLYLQNPNNMTEI